MRPYLRRSLPTKAAAAGFIALILLGNVWFILFLTGKKDQIWLSYAFDLCIIWTALAGCGMGWKMLIHREPEQEGEPPHDDPSV